MTQRFTPSVTDCTTNASEPRTESLNRTKISPLANSYESAGVGATPSTWPISSASSGKPRPEKSIRLLRFSATMLPIGSLLPLDRGGGDVIE